MKQFIHDDEIPWECHCTKNYDWQDMVEGRVIIDINGHYRELYRAAFLERAKEAIQLIYSFNERFDTTEPCTVCNAYKHRIVPNPYRKR